MFGDSLYVHIEMCDKFQHLSYGFECQQQCHVSIQSNENNVTKQFHFVN